MGDNHNYEEYKKLPFDTFSFFYSLSKVLKQQGCVRNNVTNYLYKC